MSILQCQYERPSFAISFIKKMPKNLGIGAKSVNHISKRFGDTNDTNAREVKDLMSSPIPEWIVQEIASQIPGPPPGKEKKMQYTEIWLSPAAFHRTWHTEDETSLRFCLDIDIVDNRKV